MEKDRISGDRTLGILRGLLEDKTILRMDLLGRDFERLTVVLEINAGPGGPFFQIDDPGDLREAARGRDPGKIRFEFTGQDKLPYAFTTTGGEISRDGIWIRSPDWVERIQRRRHFRLTAPLGTRLHVPRAGGVLEMTVINVSQGGVLAAPRTVLSRAESLGTGDHLRHIALVFPSEEGIPELAIREARVTREEKDPVSGKSRYALEFTHLDRKAERTLLDLIYRIQRRLLRRRGFLDA